MVTTGNDAVPSSTVDLELCAPGSSRNLEHSMMVGDARMYYPTAQEVTFLCGTLVVLIYIIYVLLFRSGNWSNALCQARKPLDEGIPDTDQAVPRPPAQLAQDTQPILEPRVKDDLPHFGPSMAQFRCRARALGPSVRDRFLSSF